MICDAGDVVVVPFPFSDLPMAKPRPALVLSSELSNDRGGTTLLCMITTASAGRRADDIAIADLEAAGLKTESVLRLKLFTLDNRLVARRIGGLLADEREAVRAALAGLIAI